MKKSGWLARWQTNKRKNVERAPLYQLPLAAYLPAALACRSRLRKNSHTLALTVQPFRLFISSFASYLPNNLPNAQLESFFFFFSSSRSAVGKLIAAVFTLWMKVYGKEISRLFTFNFPSLTRTTTVKSELSPASSVSSDRRKSGS